MNHFRVIPSLCVFLAAIGLAELNASAAEKLNVLFFAVDDLRPELGCYGVKGIKSPNIDKLASQGLLFNRAYCQQAVCSPSRTSLLTGRRPDTTRVYNLQDHFRDIIPDAVALPQHFKNNGYFCQSFGKIYHGGLDDPKSWSAPSLGSGVVAKNERGEVAIIDPDALLGGKGICEDEVDLIHIAEKKSTKKKKSAAASGTGKAKNRPPWSAPDVADNALADGQMADAAIKVMEQQKDKPFFLAVGFRKPHLSFDAPKRYYDLYQTADMKLAPNPFPPKDVFPQAMSSWGELRNYTGMPKEGPVPDDVARQLIHGYYAATSYIDAQMGRVIAALERLGLREKTIIILWGDHGWQLGDHGMWCKHTNFEIATRCMLMVSAPGQKNRGAKTDALVEFVDIFPSLSELAGLQLPAGLEGTSFAPLLDNPQRPWKTAAFSQYPRGNNLMGYAMRTDRYRYVEWVERPVNKNTGGMTKWPEPQGRELYDHQNDPQENVNLANQPAQREVVAQLSKQLHAGWQAAKPK